MGSNALADFKARLAEVEQLLDAHGALVRFKKAETKLGPQMSAIGHVVNALIYDPGPGRPREVQALNSAGIALLSGHLQGYVRDVHKEAAFHLLRDHVGDVDTLVGSVDRRGNPNRDNINRLFASLGFVAVVDGLSWQGMSNISLRAKLKEFNELRNRIVHGKSETVRKSVLQNYLTSWTKFAEKLDARLRVLIQKQTGTAPW